VIFGLYFDMYSFTRAIGTC